MSEPVSQEQPGAGATGSDGLHAGQAIRAAREARRQTLLHLSILLKINERRLQAFEDGRWDDVGDRTFVRALAQSLCRHLELDPRPILQALPAATAEPRQQPDRGLLPEASAPALKTLRRPVRMPGVPSAASWFSPVRLGVAVILLGALGLAFAPAEWWSPSTSGAPALPVQMAETSPVLASEPGPPVVVPVVQEQSPAASAPQAAAIVPAPAPAPAPEAVAVADTSSAPLQIRATQDTWVQVTDARGQVILSRLLRNGERVGVEGPRPLKMRVGNVAGTEASWQGRRVSLDESQRNNVAEVELP